MKKILISYGYYEICVKTLTGSRPKDLIKGLGGCSFLHFNLAIPSVPFHDAKAAPSTDVPLNILPPNQNVKSLYVNRT